MRADKGSGDTSAAAAVQQLMPLNAAERQELIELPRKLRQVQQERDISAKATAWFAGKSEQTPAAFTRYWPPTRPNYRLPPCANT